MFWYLKSCNTLVTESVQPTPCWQQHLLRRGSSRAGARIRGLLKPNRKQVVHNLERATIASSFYDALALDTACADRQTAFGLRKGPRVRNTLLRHKLEIPSLREVCNRRSVGSFSCFTFAAHARELSSALCYIEFLFLGTQNGHLFEHLYGGTVSASRARAQLRIGLEWVPVLGTKICHHFGNLFWCLLRT